MKILVTGTAGFIGFHLAKKLLDRGDMVISMTIMMYARLNELGINKEEITNNKLVTSKT